MPRGSHRISAAILLALLLLPTALFARRALRTPVDAANAAMKSRGTAEERAYLRRVELFGEDHIVVLALAPLPGQGEEVAAAAADTLAEVLLEVDGVIDVIDLPADGSDWTVLAVPIEGDGAGGGYAEATRRVLAAAREWGGDVPGKAAGTDAGRAGKANAPGAGNADAGGAGKADARGAGGADAEDRGNASAQGAGKADAEDRGKANAQRAGNADAEGAGRMNAEGARGAGAEDARDVEADGAGIAPPESLARLASARRSAGSPSRGVRLLAGGQPVGELAIADGVRRESRRLLPWVIGVLALFAALRYRRPLPLLALLGPPFAAIAWTGGIYQWMGYALDPVSSLLQPVVLTVGVAAGVHLVEGFRRERARGAATEEAVRRTLRELALPALLAAGTTIAGFLTLGVHAIPAIRRFGEFAALGVGLSCLLTLVAGSAVLLLGETRDGGRSPGRALRAARGKAPAGAERSVTVEAAPGESGGDSTLGESTGARSEYTARSGTGGGRPQRAARDDLDGGWPERLARGLGGGRRGVILATLLLLALGGAFWPRLHVDTDPASVLPPASTFRQDFAAMAEELGGVEGFDLLVPSRAASGKTAAVRRLERWLLARDEIVQLALRQESSAGDLLLTAVLRPGGTHARERLFSSAEQAAARFGLAGTVATGMLVRVARDSGLIVRGQVLATSLTLLVLLLVGAAGFRSWRLGLLGLLPNVVPAVLVYGALAAAGRTLSVSTVMISSVMLGLVVDDTIHFLVRYARARRSGRRREAAVARALSQAGAPVALTSIVLAAGFAVPLLFGELLTTREFGALAVGTILLALAADLLLLPALLLRGGARGAGE